MEGADGSGVQENQHLMGNGTTAAEPVTLLTVKTSLELETDEVKENRTGGEMKNGLPEPIGPNMIMNVDPPSVPQSPRSISHPQLGIIPSASEVRRILGPLIAHNSLARNGTLEKETSSAEPRGDIQNLLTDEVCNKFAGQMRVVEKQRGTLPSNGTSNMDNNKVPKAPRAMLISEKVRVLEDYLLLQDHNKDLNVNNPNLDMRIPIPSSAIGTAPPSVHEIAPSHSSSTGIAIPLETKFFTHAKNLEREEGEITSSRPPSVASDVARKASPVKKYSIDGGGNPRRSASPEPARHRLPISRTYRNRSPERLVRPSSRRSKSPSHPRRPSRPSRSPEGPRRRRSSPSPRIPHAFDRPPLISPLSATHRRRGSDDDTRRGKYTDGEPYPSRDNDNNHSESPTSRCPEGQKDAFSARDGMTSSDHSASNHDWQRGSTQERGSDAESSRPQAPIRSMSTNNINHKVDDQHKRHSPSGGPIPSPSSTVGPLPDTTTIGDFSPPPQIAKACHNVPGLWMVKSGQSRIEIVSCEFEIDTVAAEKWGIRGPSRYV
ncbi:hypothetical protein F5887DRAFT_553967 [Amanita rubescens]|nr:hypothetical protein F5887DRAFT_553967 [Amanita rubescens]